MEAYAVLTKTTTIDVLKALAEPLRWRILDALTREQLCVCHLVEDLQVSQPLVSHHLRTLRHAGLVTTTRAGAFTYYALSPDALDTVGEELQRLADAAGEAPKRPCV
jgi:ArsR family transcriptional regulator